MRKSKAETAESRKRILATSKDIFLREGIAATSIADVMTAAGLTQGGFYRHFESKEHLLAEVQAAAYDDIYATLEALAAGKSPREAVETIVHAYLYQQQTSGQPHLCPLASLSSELRHADERVKAVVAEGYARLVKFFASYLMRLDYQDYVGLAESMVSVMVGAVSLSGIVPAPAAVLANAEQTVRLLLQTAPTCVGLVCQA